MRTAISPRLAMSTFRTSADLSESRPFGPGSPASLGPASPQIGPAVTDLEEQHPQQGQRDADDVVRVTLDAFHERTAETVDREGAGHGKRLARVDVRLDLVIAQVGEVDGG